MGKLKFQMNVIKSNNNYKSALYKIQMHAAHLKMRFAQNTRKREIENLFTTLKTKYLKDIDVECYGGLTGPDIPDHFVNTKKVGCKHMIIPEINIPTMNIMTHDQVYLDNSSYIDIVHAEFFNEIMSRMITRKNIFSDIDYDGTTFYRSMRIAAAQFIIDMSQFARGVTSKFVMTFAHSMRGTDRVQTYNDFKKLTMGHIHSMSNFRVIEGHYIDYTGIGKMATAILLVEKIAPRGITGPMPDLNYYTHFKKNAGGYNRLESKFKKNSRYL